ncbi:MAG: FAD-binding oxidoreductase [Nitrospinae bacterium]|jgi:FAD/FMN-containing dehydrogenase|nr:FAD-binding oxidoreductase [Nitrospinota bacterium]MDA1108320.1 FAD-binding oxidoreductase [Nitrospinota bacterium]
MIRKIDPQTIAPYLKDASNYSGGCADEVIIPETTQELVQFLKSNDRPITISGAGTGLTASRIPESGVIISLEKFNAIGDIENSAIDVGPAVSLKNLQNHLLSTPYFYPPNPTETLASLGGTMATNASGSRSYKFGVTRDYVVEADLVLANGKSVTIRRGQSIKESLVLDDGTEISFPKTNYAIPHFKNAAGYYVQPGMDWLDLFIGSDGTLALFTRIRLKLLVRPEAFVSGILFFDSEESCWELVEKIRFLKDSLVSPCALEYFDNFSLKKLKLTHGNIPDSARSALFFEQDIVKKEDYDFVLESWFEFLSAENVPLDDSWFAQNDKDRQKFHDFRHDIPVLINEENSRLGRVKIGTDMAVADEHFMKMMHFYRRELSKSGLEYVVFGHLGNNHLHINLLPGPGEIDQARSTYDRLVDKILEWGGTVSAEHGVGKLKKSYFAKMVGPQALDELRKIKQALDTENLLGRGNIL